MGAAARNRWRGPIAVILVGLVLATLAVTHRGVPAAEVELHDGGVWVTNEALQLAAHLNYPARTLDGGVRAGSGQFDVSQRGNDVLLHDQATASLTPIDTANLELRNGSTTLDSSYTVLQGGPVTAVVQPAAGKAWVMPTAAVDGFSPEAAALVEHPGGIRVAVGLDGVVHTLTPDGEVRRIVVSNGGPEMDRVKPIDDLGDFAGVQVAAVGDRLVALDRAGAAVRTADGVTPLPNAAEAVIQQSGPSHEYALVASPTALLWAPLAGGTAREKPVGSPAAPQPGTPVPPVQLAGCGYGAWAGSGAYLRDCVDDGADESATIDRAKPLAKMRFRVNRDVVVLNNVATGLVILVNDNLRVVDNWQTVQSQVNDTRRSDRDDEDAVAETAPEERTNEQRPPLALPDELGVRAGRSTTLPVLANDSDPDGDPLTALALSEPGIGKIGRVRGGAALRVDVPADAQGAGEFAYRAEDGRGGSAETTVRIAVHPPSRNDAPKPLLTSTATVAQSDEVSYSILPDWFDPDGDDIFLAGATGPAELSIRWRPDGLVTVRDLGTGTPGTKEVAVTVTDGTASAQGKLTVQVKPRADLPPIANADHAVTWRGQETVLQPLLNDTDPNGTPPRLADVAEAAADQRIVADTRTGQVTFSSTRVGSHHVTYTITDGPNQATGTMRIDVLEPAPDAPPIADNDLSLLAAGGTAVVDVLANDSDPQGGVLVIQSVSVPPESPISVQIVDQSRLRVSAPAGLPAQTAFGYTVSNGGGGATGQVTVVPMPAHATTVPPIAVADAAVVRAGDIVTIPVLTNDSSPTGLPLELLPEVETISGADGGVAFVSGRTLRYRPGPQPGTVRLTYTVRDSAGNPASAQVVLNVTAADGPNSPPRPEPLTGRVLAGQTARIPVPTDGIDPDGDSVMLTGLAAAPSKGTAVARGTHLEYTAAPDARGSDSLDYTVTDRFGQSARGSVRIGIAPPPGTNQAPVAVADTLTVRPDRSVTVPVLANDFDSDGDTLSLIADSVVAADDGTRAEIRVDGDRVTVPARGPGVLRYYYDITDGRGGQARGVLTVAVSPEASLKVPVAADDVLTAAEVAGRDTVDVEVLGNDADPDGSLDEAKVTVEDTAATLRGGTVTVPVTDQRQVVLYSVTDPDGLTGQAAVIVPPGVGIAPTLIQERVPARVKAGESLTVRLGDWVRVRAGRSAQLTFADRVKAGPGSAGESLVKDPTTLVFTAAPNFSGRTGLTFEVTDAASPEDPTGLTATLTLPIEVEAAGLTPPEFRPAQIDVAPLEPAVEAGLTAMVTDPDPGDLAKMRFTLGEVTGGFEVRLDGSTLRVSGPERLPAGTPGTATITLTDGTTEPVTGQIQLRTIASTRPRTTVREAVIPDARAGQPSRIDLADYITNPFAAENRPVTLVGVPQVTAGTGTATAAGLVVTVTPAANFNGQVVVGYRVADATGDAGRHVEGLIRLSVQDRPGPPTDVRAATQASRTATVSWTAGPVNGSPVTGFAVRFAGGQQDCGLVTTCTVTGLTNDRAYTFTVVATNAVGDSDPSAASSEVRPDTKPNTPGAPQVADGDQQVSLTWAPATTEGSPVTGYTVEISPSAGVTQREVAGTSLTWTGLTNGTAYTFRIRAHSRAEDPSEWSAQSPAVTPAGVPGAPAAPRVTKQPVSALAPAATVAWSAPAGNGDTNLTYQVHRNGAIVYTGTDLSTQVQLTSSIEPQTFRVMARNRKGDSPWSPTSAPIRAFSNPGAVTSLTAVPTGTDNQVRLTFGAADGNGAAPGELTYHWSANGQGGTVPAGGGTVTSAGGFPNGTAVNVQVFARSAVGGETATGPTQSASVTAYGPPTSPTVSCTGGGQAVNCQWIGGGANGRSTRFQATGDLNQAVNSPGSWAFNGIGHSATRRICIQAIQEGGATGTNNCGQAASNPAPPPPPPPPPPASAPASYSWQSGGRYTGTGCSFATGCKHAVLTLRNYRPNSQVRCEVPGVGAAPWYGTFTVDGGGNWGPGNATGPPGPAVAATGYNIQNDFGTCTQR